MYILVKRKCKILDKRPKRVLKKNSLSNKTKRLIKRANFSRIFTRFQELATGDQSLIISNLRISIIIEIHHKQQYSIFAKY